MKRDFEQIRDEMVEMINNERAENKKRADEETQIRADYEAAQQEMSAALESGSMDRYKAAGMEAEEKRLELEFIEKRKARGLEPGATVDDENRFRAALFREYDRIRIDSLAQLKSIYTEERDVSYEALRQLAALDNLFSEFEITVMRKPKDIYYVSNLDARINLSQRMNAAKAALQGYQYIKGV